MVEEKINRTNKTMQAMTNDTTRHCGKVGLLISVVPLLALVLLLGCGNKLNEGGNHEPMTFYRGVDKSYPTGDRWINLEYGGISPDSQVFFIAQNKTITYEELFSSETRDVSFGIEISLEAKQFKVSFFPYGGYLVFAIDEVTPEWITIHRVKWVPR